MPEGIRTKDGKVWPADALVLATGFKVSKMLHPMTIVGKDGRELHDVWGTDDAKAYLGLTVPGFPNFFMLTGPNTGLAHGGNQIFMTECSVRHMMLALRELLESGHRSIECRREVYESLQSRRRRHARAHGVDPQGHDQLVPQPARPGVRHHAVAAGRILEDDIDVDPAEYEIR